MTKKLLSLTENTVKSGMGHYMRQTALKNYLLERDIDLYIVRDPDEYFEIKVAGLSKNIVLIDLSEETQSQFNLAALDFKNKFCFDWSASQIPDINVIVSEWSDKKFGYRSEKYSGFEYFIINEDVFSVPIGEKNYCLITVGAYLNEDFLSKILKKLKFYGIDQKYKNTVDFLIESLGKFGDPVLLSGYIQQLDLRRKIDHSQYIGVNLIEE